MRVCTPDKENWSKLIHLMQYITGTRTLALILSANGSGILKWWVDASFAVYHNMQGNSRGGLSLGCGFPIVRSTKQKLNTKISTDIEIVGFDDFMPAIFWTRYFIAFQGYNVKDNCQHQDNKSYDLMGKNGKTLIRPRTKHINIRYFFITHRVKKVEFSLLWCSTGDMIGDYMTK